VARFMLQPGFDESVIKKQRLRRDLALYTAGAMRGDLAKVEWALCIIDGIRIGRSAQSELSWDPSIAVTDGAWYLPQVGEWMPPMTFEEMGIVRPEKPDWDPVNVAFRTDLQRGIMYSAGGLTARVETVEKLWYLMVAHLRAETGSERERATARHMRSIGWGLFFAGGKDAFIAHLLFLSKASRTMLEDATDEDQERELIRPQGLDAPIHYKFLPNAVSELWNRTGDWLILP